MVCRARAQEGSKVVVSPITGDLIPVDQMAEHMRISLIDPKFQEQRQAMMSKIRETTKASDDEIGRNLMGLARKRPDVFGDSRAPLKWKAQQCKLAAPACVQMRVKRLLVHAVPRDSVELLHIVTV